MGAMAALTDHATFLRESLSKSQANTEGMVSILDSFDNRLSATRPTQVRAEAIRLAHNNIEKTLKSTAVILGHFDRMREAENKILMGPHEDLESYLEAVEQFRGILRFFSSDKILKSCDGVLNHVNNLLAKSILKLEDEFGGLLAKYSKPVECDCLLKGLPDSLRPSSGSPNQQGDNVKHSSGTNNSEHQAKSLENAVYTPPTLLPPRIVPLLRKLAQQLVYAGHQQQCLKIYREFRASALEKSLSSLGVEKLSKYEVQKLQGESLEAKVGNWIHFMRIAVKLLFAGECQLCDRILEGFGSLKDQCFAEVTANSVEVLLSFGEAISRERMLPEKLFVLLDMYGIMRELHPEIEAIFEAKACLVMRESALSLTKHLAQAARETYGNFEERVEKDASKTTVADGSVHPLTSDVINYMKFLFTYQSTLKHLFEEFEPGDETNSQLATVTMRIMQALQSNLDVKSKQYKDPALTYLFLMNNIHYMVRSVRRSEAMGLLGDDWIQRHRRIVQQNANQYRRVALAKILQSLSGQGLFSSGGSRTLGNDGGNSSGVSRETVKERLKSFNVQFGELLMRQCQWTVPDQELRESLRLAVAEVLLPAYRSFVKRFGPLVKNGKNPQKYIRYTPEDLERMLGEFFEGKTLAPRR